MSTTSTLKTSTPLKDPRRENDCWFLGFEQEGEELLSQHLSRADPRGVIMCVGAKKVLECGPIPWGALLDPHHPSLLFTVTPLPDDTSSFLYNRTIFKHMTVTKTVGRGLGHQDFTVSAANGCRPRACMCTLMRLGEKVVEVLLGSVGWHSGPGLNHFPVAFYFNTGKSC